MIILCTSQVANKTESRRRPSPSEETEETEDEERRLSNTTPIDVHDRKRSDDRHSLPKPTWEKGQSFLDCANAD